MASRERQVVRYLTTSDNVRIAWAETGSGAPLVKASNWLSHLEFDWESPVFRHWVRFFSDHFRLIRYDERGCGLTDWNASNLSLERWTDDLEEVIDAARIDPPFTLLGVSQGGATCISYLARHPERVSRLILYGSYARGVYRRGDPDGERMYRAILDLVRVGWAQDNPAFRQVFTSRFIPKGTEAQIQWFNALAQKTTSPQIAAPILDRRAEIDVAGLLEKVRVPTLVLHARDDAVVPSAEGRLIAARIPNAQFVELDSCNHILLENEPAWGRFCDAVLEFTGQKRRPAAASPREPLESVGRYQVVRPLGSGGMGEVYLAEDPKLQRKVALKILSKADEKSKRRFVREAITASQLSHPNAAVVYEAGESDGIAFIAMQYVEGETLRDRLLRGPMPLDEIVRLTCEVADALDEAHRRGIVHRDIKPGNIMIDTRGHAKVLDFGIAKTANAVDTSELTDARTGSGMFVGTLQYASPEQMSGGDVDHRSDIYSLGLVVREMLAGRKHARLQKVAARCLEKDPARRYQSARDIVTDLQPPAGRRSDLPIALGVVVLLIALAVLWLVERRPRAAMQAARAKIDSVAVLPFVNFSPERENEYIGDGISEEVINGLAQLGGLKVVSRTSSFTLKGTRADAREVGRLLGVDALVEGSVQRSGKRLRVTAQLIDAHDGFHLWSQTYSGAVDDVFSIEDQIARSVARALQRSMGKAVGLTTHDIAAYDLYLKARHEQQFMTREHFDNAIASYRAAIDRDPGFAEAWAGMAEAYSLMDHRVGLSTLEPKQSWSLAVQAAQKALSIDPDSAEAHMALGHIEMHLGHFDEADAHLKRALELNPNLAHAMLWHGVLVKVTGHCQNGSEELARAARLDPRSEFILVIMSSTSWHCGEYEMARTAALRGSELDPEDPQAYISLAEADGALGRFSEAEQALQKSESLGGSANLDPARALVLALAGRRNEAKRLLGRISPTAGSAALPRIMRAWAATGAYDEAARALNRAVAETPDYARISIDIPPHPALVKFRSDPRYLEARRKLGLPPPENLSGTAGTSRAGY
jgi:TolB-like protein/pimeloyl-ACP methyl ester carboxylesterase/Flp pilus assembly protein TadD